jgi:hypothetical protein
MVTGWVPMTFPSKIPTLPPKVSNLTRNQQLKLITINHDEKPSTANYNTWIMLIYCPRDGSQTPHRKKSMSKQFLKKKQTGHHLVSNPVL